MVIISFVIISLISFMVVSFLVSSTNFHRQRTIESTAMKTHRGAMDVISSNPPPIFSMVNSRISNNIIMCGTRRLLTDSVNINISRIKKENPDYNFLYFDDIDMEDFIGENMGVNVVDAYNKISVGVARADFFRYCAVYVLGGFYFDLKSSPKVSLHLINKDPNQKMLIGQWTIFKGGKDSSLKLIGDDGNIIFPEPPQRLLCNLMSGVEGGEYCQWFLAAAPGHPYIKRVIDYITELINTTIPNEIKNTMYYSLSSKRELYNGRLGILYITGPIAFTCAIGKLDFKNDPLVTYIGKTNDPNFPFAYNSAYSGNDQKRYDDAKRLGHIPYYDHKGSVFALT